jgi:hypothetical protein
MWQKADDIAAKCLQLAHSLTNEMSVTLKL